MLNGDFHKRSFAGPSFQPC